MKKILDLFAILFLTLLISFPSSAYGALGGDENFSSLGGMDSLMESSRFMDDPYAGQKHISDEEFQKAIEQLKEKKDGKKNKKFKKQGDVFHDPKESEYITETLENNLILLVPLELKNGDGTDIPIGYYKIIGEKDGNKVYLKFYQSYTLVAKVPAIETQEDFNEREINFAKIMPHNEERIRLIYGSLDFNAYTFIRIKNKISDKN